MPMDSLLVAIGVCVIFLLFAFVVAWVDHTTTRWLSDRADANRAATDTKPPYHKAA
jgi:antibiotic biosynthesis monooxygenase (ABM) superfamily enzyme